MKQVPYTTSAGVKIGLRWNESPKPMPIDDLDMERLQGWLICSPEWHKSRSMDRIAYGMSAVVAVITLLFMLVAQ
jgi:hypothetical protein